MRMPPSLCLHERLLHSLGFVSPAVMRKATDKPLSVLQHLLTDSIWRVEEKEALGKERTSVTGSNTATRA